MLMAHELNKPLAEIEQGLRGVGDDHPLWQAVLKLCDYQKEVADRQTLEEELPSEVRAHRAGAEWALKNLKASLLVLHRQANPKGGA